MALNAKSAVYDGGIKEASGDKPSPVDGDDKTWQWKFLETPQSDPDPYAVYLYNRNAGEGTKTTVNEKNKFALLNWYDSNGVDATAYTLAVAGSETYTYEFLNGSSMNTTTAATTATEPNFKSTSCSYTNNDAKIVLIDDVSHTYIYKIYNNSNTFAVSATQTQGEAEENSFVPTLPEEIKSPLLNSVPVLWSRG